MFDEVIVSDNFMTTFQELQPQKRRIVAQKVELLIQNPQHPSLNVHQVKRTGNKNRPIKECYIDEKMRILYEIKERRLLLWGLGGHAMIDRAHQRGFNETAATFFWKDLVSATLPTAQLLSPQNEGRPAPQQFNWQAEPITVTENTTEHVMNYFAYFREALLHVLGISTEYIPSIQAAETLDEVFNLPNLPESMRNRLLDVATSPHMETVLLRPEQLLYRTQLNRLDGFLEGHIKKLMLNLEEEQQQYVDLEGVPLLLLKGTAGCGKTTIGIHRAIRLAEQGRRVLVVTFNKTLAREMRHLIEERTGSLPVHLEVKTLHSVMRTLLGSSLHLPTHGQEEQPHRFLREALREVRLSVSAQVLQREEKFFREEIERVIKGLGLINLAAYKAIKRYGRKTALGPPQREAVWKVYEAYQRRLEAAGLHDWPDVSLLVLRQSALGPLNKIYDDIIVDEAQDFKPVDLRVIQLLAAPQASIMILGDAAQTLYSRGFSWVQAGISARGRTFILRINYRNTCQIAEAASQLIGHNVLMRDAKEYVDPQWTRKPGPLPLVLIAENGYKQIDLVYQQILQLLEEQRCRPADIAILCKENTACLRYKSILTNKGLRVALHNDQDFHILEEQIKVMTIHSAKGLEFPVVFLPGLIEGHFPCVPRKEMLYDEEALLDIERERILCYVGMTRAADLLYLVTVKGQESRFLRELAGRIALREQAS